MLPWNRPGTAPQVHILECESASITWLLTVTSFRAVAASAKLGKQFLLFLELRTKWEP